MHFEYDGYHMTCEPVRDMARRTVSSLARPTNTTFKIRVTDPEDVEIEHPFSSRVPALSLLFRVFVNMIRGNYDLHHDGHHYRPFPVPRWRHDRFCVDHVVRRPDGTVVRALFVSHAVLKRKAFETWLHFGGPSPHAFGREYMSMRLLAEMRRVSDQFNIEPLNWDAMSVLMRLSQR